MYDFKRAANSVKVRHVMSANRKHGATYATMDIYDALLLTVLKTCCNGVTVTSQLIVTQR